MGVSFNKQALIKVKITLVFLMYFSVGARYDDGSYQVEGEFSVTWAIDQNESGDVWFRSIGALSSNIDAGSIGKSFGLSVRMVQD